MTRELTDHIINPAYDMYKIKVEGDLGADPVTSKPKRDADPDPEEDLMQRILAECFETDISAVHAAGACHAVGVLLLAKAYKLIKDPEQESE